MDDMMNISFHASDDVRSHPVNRDGMIYDWTIEDYKTLCARIKDASLRLNKAINAAYNKIENRLDWEGIAFGDHDAEECRKKWQLLCTNIRTYRTMAEIVGDAELWLQKGPRRIKEAKVMGKSHPDKPGKPLSVFLRFLMEQLPKLKKKHPELAHKQLVSKIGEMYKSVTPKKMDQLKAEYLKEKEEYDVRLEEFYNAHPEVAPSKGPTNATPKGTSGLAFFIAERLNDPQYSDASKDDLKAKWSKLKDEKKIPYIEMALDAHRRNSDPLHFIAKPAKDVLSKEERLVYDRFLGKPEKPPSSGFALYKSIACATKLKDMNVAQRNLEVLQTWNSMSRPDQNKFKNEAKIIKQQYEKKMEEYLKRLADREQKLSEGLGAASINNIGLESTKVINGASAPKRPKLEKSPSGSPKKSAVHKVVQKASPKKVPKKLTALSWYQESHLEQWKELNPELTDEELRSAIEDQFSSLPEKKKLRWAKKAEEENERRGLN